MVEEPTQDLDVPSETIKEEKQKDYQVCHFVMGLSTWAKCKLGENWLASLFEAIMKMEGFSNVGHGEKFGLKKENKFHYKKACHEGGFELRARHFKRGKA